MKLTALALLVLTACASVDTPAEPPRLSGDDFDIQATVLAVYNVISGPAGRRDWNRFKELFAPGARLIHGDKVMTPEEFQASATPGFNEHGFFERPVVTRIEHSRDVAQVWSVAETRGNSGDEKPTGRAAHSFQLVRREGRWQVQTILWQEE